MKFSIASVTDPAQTQAGEINNHDGGRGVYFEDPDGHLLEVITRAYEAAAGILDVTLDLAMVG
jgi:hypothetical protein